jgi:hypothetical protein
VLSRILTFSLRFRSSRCSGKRLDVWGLIRRAYLKACKRIQHQSSIFRIFSFLKFFAIFEAPQTREPRISESTVKCLMRPKFYGNVSVSLTVPKELLVVRFSHHLNNSALEVVNILGGHEIELEDVCLVAATIQVASYFQLTCGLVRFPILITRKRCSYC